MASAGGRALYVRKDKGARHHNYLSSSKEPEIQEDFFGGGEGGGQLEKKEL